MSISRKIYASDLSATDLGKRVGVTTLTGVLIEDVLAEVRYFGPDRRETSKDNEPEPQVWVRFAHAAAVADFENFGREGERGFFLSPTSEAIVTN